MSECPNCREYLLSLDEDILDETEECLYDVNCRLYECPFCGCKLIINIKVDLIEIEEL